MRRILALALCAWLGLGAPAQAALAAGWPEPVRIAAPLPPPPAATADAPFNAKLQPLPKPYLDLLARNKYAQRDDGTVWAPDGKAAVSQKDMPFLLHKLESGARLQALLKLDMLLSNSDGEKYLSPAEREQLRQIVRENWPYFTLGTRKDFRHFFTLQELEQMNLDPAPTDTATALTMSDPAPEDYTNVEAPPIWKPVPMPRLLPAPPPPQAAGDEPAAAVATQAPAPAAAAAPTTIYVVAQMPGGGAAGLPSGTVLVPALPPAAGTGASAAPAVTILPAAAGLAAKAPPAAPVAPAPAAVAQAASPAPAAPAGPIVLPPTQPAIPNEGVLKPWTPPAAQAAAGSVAAPVTHIAGVPAVTAGTVAAAALAAASANPGAAALAVPSRATFATTGAAVSPATVAAVAAPAAAAAPAPAAVAPAPKPAEAAPPPLLPTQPVPQAGLPPVRVVPAADFDRFLGDAPYGREAKDLLRMISERAVEPSRSRALGAVLANLPQIVFDTARAGLDAHAALLAIETPQTRAYTIALAPGPIVETRKHLFGKGPTVLLSDSAKIYASLHVPVPEVDAAKRDAVAVSEQKGEWGQERLYADGSRRGAYSPEEQAGFLLRKLLRLDASHGGWDASAYAAEAYARSAQWMLYAKLAQALHRDDFLDPATRIEFHQWRDHPEEYRDHLIHMLAGGRVQTIDPRKGNAETQAAFDHDAQADCLGVFKTDIKARLDADREALKKDALELNAAGLIEGDQLDASRKAIDADFAAVRLPEPTPQQCYWRFASEESNLHASAALFAEMNQAERQFRTDMAHVDDR